MRWAGWWLGPFLGVASAYTVFVLLGRIWHFCHMGIPSANGFALLFIHASAAFLAAAALSGATYALLYRTPVRGRSVVAALGAVAVAAMTVWIVVWVAFDPNADGYKCVPPWWPQWIPL